MNCMISYKKASKSGGVNGSQFSNAADSFDNTLPPLAFINDLDTYYATRISFFPDKHIGKTTSFYTGTPEWAYRKS